VGVGFKYVVVSFDSSVSLMEYSGFVKYGYDPSCNSGTEPAPDAELRRSVPHPPEGKPP
jgi:hypothetical protein